MILNVDINDNAFITLTFNDASLNNLSYSTRRKRVREFLKSQCALYVANIDFGKKNGREHYHAVVSNRVDPSLWAYGSCNAIKITRYNSKALAKYVNKLTNHALKDTANKGASIIYSKGLKI